MKIEPAEEINLEGKTLPELLAELRTLRERLALTEGMADAIEETENAWERGWDPSRVEAHRLFCEKLARVFEALAAWRGA